tara:strand:+ start:162 stop:539 length:378 start_codon:yes stop_codon:yes gene_type:complete
MAAPNVVNVTSIYGKTVFDADISTGDDVLLENAAGSNKLLKINSLIISNIDGTNAADITVTIKNAAGNSILGYLAKTISVPADTTLVVISKDTSIYLEEDMEITLDASAAGDLSAVCSYEELDDA